MIMWWNILQSIVTILEIRVCVWLMECFGKPRYYGKKQRIVVWIVTIGVGILYVLNRWIATYYSRVIILLSLILLGLATFWIFVYYRGPAFLVAINYLMIGGLLDLAFMGIAEAVTRRQGFFVYIFNTNNGYRIAIMCLSKLLLFFVFWLLQKNIDREVVYHLTEKEIKVLCVSLCVIEYEYSG